MTETTEMKFTLRKLQSKDIFPMTKILNKVGIGELKECFASEEVKNAMGNKNDVDSVGLAIGLEIAGIIIGHLSDAESDIYEFLSGLSGMDVKELEELDIATFTEMVFEIFKKDEFKDFILVVSKFLQ